MRHAPQKSLLLASVGRERTDDHRIQKQHILSELQAPFSFFSMLTRSLLARRPSQLGARAMALKSGQWMKGELGYDT